MRTSLRVILVATLVSSVSIANAMTCPTFIPQIGADGRASWHEGNVLWTSSNVVPDYAKDQRPLSKKTARVLIDAVPGEYYVHCQYSTDSYTETFVLFSDKHNSATGWKGWKNYDSRTKVYECMDSFDNCQFTLS